MHEPASARSVLSFLGAWLAAAVLLGASGAVALLAPPMPQLVLAGLTAALLVGAFRAPFLRRWIEVVDVRWLAGLHLSRFVGAWFLVLHARGELPWAFAVPGGIGDIAVATAALALLAAGPPGSPGRRRAWLIWNAVGLADILFVVATAARCAMQEPASMALLLRLPLSLLPTFLVPLIIASHVVLFWRLGARGAVQPCQSPLTSRRPVPHRMPPNVPTT